MVYEFALTARDVDMKRTKSYYKGKNNERRTSSVTSWYVLTDHSENVARQMRMASEQDLLGMMSNQLPWVDGVPGDGREGGLRLISSYHFLFRP